MVFTDKINEEIYVTGFLDAITTRSNQRKWDAKREWPADLNRCCQIKGDKNESRDCWLEILFKPVMQRIKFIPAYNILHYYNHKIRYGDFNLINQPNGDKVATEIN